MAVSLFHGHGTSRRCPQEHRLFAAWTPAPAVFLCCRRHLSTMRAERMRHVRRRLVSQGFSCSSGSAGGGLRGDQLRSPHELVTMCRRMRDLL